MSSGTGGFDELLNKTEKLKMQARNQECLELIEREWERSRLLPPSAVTGHLCCFAMLACYRLAPDRVDAASKNEMYGQGHVWKARARVRFALAGYVLGPAALLLSDATQMASDKTMTTHALGVVDQVLELVSGTPEEPPRSETDVIDGLTHSVLRLLAYKKKGSLLFRVPAYEAAAEAYEAGLRSPDDHHERLTLEGGLLNCRYAIARGNGDRQAVAEAAAKTEELSKRAEARAFERCHLVAAKNARLMGDNSSPEQLHSYDTP